MRTVAALLALSGCRSILGIEDVETATPSDGAPADVGFDAIDAPPDGHIACPSGYVMLPNSGSRGHRYRLASPGAKEWVQQRNFCMTDGGFLAFPDGAQAAQELSAIVTLGGLNVWIGVDDRVVEGDYVTSLNMPASAATTALIGAGGPGNDDCLIGTTTAMQDEDCSVSHPAVCECVP